MKSLMTGIEVGGLSCLAKWELHVLGSLSLIQAIVSDQIGLRVPYWDSFVEMYQEISIK